MASPSEKLAESLQVLRNLQQAGVVAIRSSNLTRTHRERLIKNGFLHVDEIVLPALIQASSAASAIARHGDKGKVQAWQAKSVLPHAKLF